MSAVPNIELNNGQQMPAVGLGTWTVNEDGIKSALDAGYRLIDCALVYQNEAAVGRAIKAKIAQGIVKREDIFVVSKLWNTYHRPDVVVKGCKRTLNNLGLDYLDMLIIHWPMGWRAPEDPDKQTKEFTDAASLVADPELFPKTESDEIAFSEDDYVDTWKKLEECVRLGLVKSIGVSNFNIKQLKRILEVAEIKPAINEVEIHPYMTQKKLREFCKSQGITIVGYSPLGSQVPVRPEGLEEIIRHPVVEELAREKGKASAQIVLRYLFQLDVVSIPKSSNPERQKQNLSIFDFSLSSEDTAKLDGLNINHRYVDLKQFVHHPHYPFKDDDE